VAAVGELEVLDFMENEQRGNKDSLSDARYQERYQYGTMAGPINTPLTHSKDASFQEMVRALELCDALHRIEVSPFTRQMDVMEEDFKTEQGYLTNVKKPLLWRNRSTCGQSPGRSKVSSIPATPEEIPCCRGQTQTRQLRGAIMVVPI
jgi:hypothetical protein